MDIHEVLLVLRDLVADDLLDPAQHMAILVAIDVLEHVESGAVYDSSQ